MLSLEEIEQLRAAVLEIHLGHSVKEYAADLVRATREHESVVLGASPRGTLNLLRAAQAFALAWDGAPGGLDATMRVEVVAADTFLVVSDELAVSDGWLDLMVPF